MTIRAPKIVLTLGGITIPVSEATGKQTKKNTSSSFSAKTSLTAMAGVGADLTWMATQTEVQVSLTINGGQIFEGTVDHFTVSLDEKSQEVSISGRDASKNIKDTKNNTAYVNKTSQEAATDAAGQGGVGLTSDGGTGITGRVGAQDPQVRPMNNPSNWQALRRLAEGEGKVVAIKNGQVYFNKLDDESLPVYPVQITPAMLAGVATSSGLIKVTLSRDMNAAKQHTVTVKSWDHKKKAQITATATGGSGSPPQVYTYAHHHQLTQAEAQKLANSKLAEHRRHELEVTVEMPGDEKLTPFFQLGLSGTGSPWDQNYNIDDIEHKASLTGYQMTISTKASKKGSKSK